MSSPDRTAARLEALRRTLADDGVQAVLVTAEPNVGYLTGFSGDSSYLLLTEGRAIVVATHDVAAARDFDRVLCLNDRQVAFGEPARTLSRRVLEATYESEIVVLEEDDGPVRAVAVQHHEH